MSLLGKYAKAVTALVGGAVSVLQHYYGAEPGFSGVIIALTALGVYGVANVPKAGAVNAP